MPTILTITPNPLLDYIAVGSVVSGKVSRVGAFEPVAGGKGINVARVLARHGHRVIASGFAGCGQGGLLTDLVKTDGITAAFVPVAARARIGFQVVDAARSRSTAVLESGFAVTAAESAALLRRIRDFLAMTDLVLVGGSVPCVACTDLIRQICDLCYRADRPCWVDAYGPAMDEALAGPHPPQLAKPNRQEYGTGRAWLACEELHLTDGARPVTVRSPLGRFRVTAPRIREVNPVGSGDCYLAALAHARLSGWPMEDQLAYATAAGAVNAQRSEVARLGPDDIRPLMRKVTVEKR
jgi:fructose-1-phosphate kinase PfkB-like protein